MANSVDPDQTVPIGAVCSGFTLFASILNKSVMLGNHLPSSRRLQQTTFSDAFFSWRLKGQMYYLQLNFAEHISGSAKIILLRTAFNFLDTVLFSKLVLLILP